MRTNIIVTARRIISCLSRRVWTELAAQGCAPEPVVLGGMRGGELLVAFGALLLAVFVLLFVVSLKLTITSKAMTTAVPMPRIHKLRASPRRKYSL
jgi:hypothetical protein